MAVLGMVLRGLDEDTARLILTSQMEDLTIAHQEAEADEDSDLVYLLRARRVELLSHLRIMRADLPPGSGDHELEIATAPTTDTATPPAAEEAKAESDHPVDEDAQPSHLAAGDEDGGNPRVMNTEAAESSEQIIREHPARQEPAVEDPVVEAVGVGSALHEESASEGSFIERQAPATADVQPAATEATIITGTTPDAGTVHETSMHIPSACDACGDSFALGEVWQADCGHSYCIECLEGYFRAAVDDESLYPPHCCDTLPICQVFGRLPFDLILAYGLKSREYEDTDRTYCHRPNCSSYIDHDHIWRDIATCQQCSGLTCTTCKHAAHDKDCPEDEAMNQTLQLAEGNGWQRCPGCHTLVALTYGCNHMVCSCGHQFCFRCLAGWKTCACEQVTPANLRFRENDRVDLQTRAPDAREPASPTMRPAPGNDALFP